MKNIIILPLLLFSFNLFAANACYMPSTDSYQDVYSFTDSILSVVDASDERHEVMDISITKFGINQGTGDVSVFTNDKDELTGVKVQFKVDGKINVLSKSFEQLKNGDKLEYFEKSSSKYPGLVLKKSKDSAISELNGGAFTVSILSKKPATYKSYRVYLRKVDGKWIVRGKSSKIYKRMDLTPNAPGFKWNGTFSTATFYI